MTELSIQGREVPLGSLRAALEAARQGSGRLVMVSGEAGIGKTALVTQLAEEAAASGVRATWGRAWEFAEAPPYFPLWPCLRVLGIETGSQGMVTQAEGEPQSGAFRLWELERSGAGHRPRVVCAGTAPTDRAHGRQPPVRVECARAARRSGGSEVTFGLLPTIARAAGGRGRPLASGAVLRPGGWCWLPAVSPSVGEAQGAVWSLVMESWGGPVLSGPEVEGLLARTGFATVRTFPTPSWPVFVAGRA